MDSYITYGYGGSVLEPSHITGPLHKTVGTGAKSVGSIPLFCQVTFLKVHYSCKCMGWGRALSVLKSNPHQKPT